MTIFCKECSKDIPGDLDHFKPHKNGRLYAPCRECRNAYSRRWRIKNSEKCEAYDELEKRKEYRKLYRENNKEYFANWRKNHKEESNTYVKQRLKDDPAYRACANARGRVRNFLRYKNKFSKTLGCSFEEFKKHIESQFSLEMSWENYGQWHIDHKYPLSIAYLEGPESFAKACLFNNLQPMWATDNLRKYNKIR